MSRVQCVVLLTVIAACSTLCSPVSVGSSAFAPDGSSFRRDYTYVPAVNGWVKFHIMPAKWVEARMACYDEGAVLASPNNKSMLEALTTLLQGLSQPKQIYIGVHSLATSQDYYSQEGVHLSEIAVTWAPGEPDNKDDNERCLTMTPEGLVADSQCDLTRPFVCYQRKFGAMAMNECGNYNTGYAKDPRTGSCYKFHSEMVTWIRAHSVCTAEGGHLAIINSPTEAEVLKELSAKAPYEVFVGMYNWHHDSVAEHWSTLDGKKLSEAGYEHWRKGEPNNANYNEQCGAYLSQKDGVPVVLNDYSCQALGPFICEIDKSRLLRNNIVIRGRSSFYDTTQYMDFRDIHEEAVTEEVELQ